MKQSHSLPARTPAKAKTPLMQKLQKAFRIALASDRQKIAPAELSGLYHEHDASRRKFIMQTSKGLIGLGLGSMYLQSCNKDDVDSPTGLHPSVVIIGAGIAGLHCAYVLQKSGIKAQVYEAATRTGGRIYTAQNIMANGLSTELGGEFIDSSHEDMLALATEFGFPLIDLQSAANNGLIEDTYFFNGQQYTEQDVIDAFVPIAATLQADIDQLPDSITYDNPGTAVLFDNISLAQYISNLSCDAWLKQLLTVAFITEYGLEAGQQSCINMLYLISTDTSAGKFDVFGESDERYKIAGGNQQVTTALTQKLQSQVTYEYSLEAVARKSNGQYVLTFKDQNNTSADVMADYVVFALPFTILRSVHFSFPLPAWKSYAINKLGYGTNAKLLLGFDSRPWRSLGYRGYAFANNGVQNGWDNSELQPGTAGGYTMFFGGTAGVNLGAGTVQSQAATHLPSLEQIYPGATAHYNGNAERYHWPTSPFVKGSYACYKTGQFTTIAGAEGKPVDKLYFAGEHCSLSFQGYMNGGAETGRIAAEDILRAIG